MSGEIGSPASFGDNSRDVVTGNNTNATAVLDGVTISHASGAGVSNTIGRPTLKNIIISSNSGAGMKNVSSNPTLTNVTISANATGIHNESSNPTLTNVTISANSYVGIYNLSSNPSLTNVTISHNSNGGVYNMSSNPTLTNVTISGNSGAYGGGGIANINSNPVLRNVVISGNRATALGGAMYNDGGSPTLTNVTISGNDAPNNGAAIFSRPGTQVTIRNSIIWGNRTPAIAGGRNDIQYSDIQGGHSGTGNLNTDPLFVAGQPAGLSTSGNYRLRDRSPLINKGRNADVPSTLTTDREGRPRIVGGTVDMGAYKSNLVPSITTLQSSLNPARYGESVTYTARVTGSMPTLKGSITFMDGTTVLANRPLVDGQASLSMAKLSGGTHNLKAVYSGSSMHTLSTSPMIVQTIRKAVTTTTLTSSPNPMVVGQPITFKARVVAATGGTPSGTVTFTEGTTVLGSAMLDGSGVATLTRASLNGGKHTIAANYAGTPNFAANASAPLTLTIAQFDRPLR